MSLITVVSVHIKKVTRHKERGDEDKSRKT